jgi:RNA polymerase sigma-70 factor (ECF subfamily)
MRALASGDDTALAELLARYEHGLAAFIYRNTGGRDVEDLFQETWLRVVRSATRFDTDRRFSTWLFQIAVNLCRDQLRKQGREGTQRGFGEPSRGRVGADAHVDPRPERAIDAERLLARLPVEQREALILKYYHDMPETRIAEVLECPRGTVKSRVHNALARLASLVEEDET